MLAEGKTLEEAAQFGSKAASIACTRKGAQPSIPTKQEVIDFE
jgi:ribokinase